MKKKKIKFEDERVIVFEEDGEGNYHIDRKETFDVAYAMFNTLDKTCPGCAMGVISMLISMLAITYIKEDAKRKKIFDHKDWIEYIINGAMTAIDRHEHTNTSVN